MAAMDEQNRRSDGSGGSADLAQRFLAMAKAAESGFWGTLGCRLEYIGERQATVALTVQDRHLNPLGILHGGVHASLLDNAMGLAVMAARPGEKVVTANLNVQYVAPGRKGLIRARAEIVHQTRRMITAQGRVESADGALLAIGVGSFRVID
jgi:uncharacterized protein (TIGR00369 family)